MRCENCEDDAAEDIYHLILGCDTYTDIRNDLIPLIMAIDRRYINATTEQSLLQFIIDPSVLCPNMDYKDLQLAESLSRRLLFNIHSRRDHLRDWKKREKDRSHVNSTNSRMGGAGT